MVHARPKKTFAVQPGPQADRAEFGRGWQAMAGKIQLRLVRHQIHIRKNCDADQRLLGNLRAPAGFGPGVIAFAFFKSKREQKFVQVHKKPARATKGVMVVVAPAEAELVLPEFLDARGVVAAFPIRAFRFKKDLAGLVAPHEFETFGQQPFCQRDAIGIVRKKTPACIPGFPGLEDRRQLSRPQRCREKTAISAAFHGLDTRAIFFVDHNATELRERFALDLPGQIVPRDEVGNRFRAQRQGRRILFLAGAQNHPRQRCARMMQHEIAGRHLNFIGHKANRAQRCFVVR